MRAKQPAEVAVHDAPVAHGAGLAWTGSHLWLADYEAKQLVCLDPSSMVPVRRLASHGTPAGLTWDGQLLWQNVFGAGVAVGLDIETGHVRRRAVLPEDRGLVHMAGLAWDGTLLWCGSQIDGLLHGVDVPEEQVIRTLQSVAPLGGLTWDGQCLWVGAAIGLRWDGLSWVEEAPAAYLLLGLNPNDGQVLRRHDLPYGRWAWRGMALTCGSAILRTPGSSRWPCGSRPSSSPL